VWAGHDDWHLPDIYELMSIVHCNTHHPSIDSDDFRATPSNRFWTISTYVSGSGDTADAWTVSFADGEVDNAQKDQQSSVRCVRNPDPPVRELLRYERRLAEEPVVSDRWTGLQWQGCEAGLTGAQCESGEPEGFEWYESLEYCEGLTWGEHSDWRLPNVRELASILDTRRREPTIQQDAFPRTSTYFFFTSSVHADAGILAWGVNFDRGELVGVATIQRPHVRCVRDGP
jgi:hypothetical protein